MNRAVAILFGATMAEPVLALEERLRAAGARVERVTNGLEVIERALFSRYDAIVVDSSVQMLEPPQVRDLLKANPKTQALPVFLIDLEHRHAAAPAGTYLPNPLADLGWISGLLDSESVEEPGGSIHADLTDLPLTDLVQMLVQNQRTGVIELDAEEQVGRIELAGDGFGRITIDENITGLKALARMVGWEQGAVRFQPLENLETRMEGTAQSLILDAARLHDEAGALRREVPSGSRLIYRTRTDTAVPSNPLLEEILLLVDFFGAVDDILARLDAPDAEILRGIKDLAKQEWIEILSPEKVERRPSQEWADLEVPPAWLEADHPTVWVFGQDADYVRLLWSDARLQKRVLNRRSLRNPGRFGGNGWLVDLVGGTYVWLRLMPPSPELLPFCFRDGDDLMGVLFFIGEADADAVESMQAVAEAMSERGLRPVWLPVDHDASGGERPWLEAAWEDAPGTIVVPEHDPLNGFWQALQVIVQGHESG